MTKETPWAVNCSLHGKVCLTREEYNHQISRLDSLWMCPKCGGAAYWDDDHYKHHMFPEDFEDF